jgi:hypothetical protein
LPSTHPWRTGGSRSDRYGRKIDTVLRELRATSPDPTGEKAALNDLLGVLG